MPGFTRTEFLAAAALLVAVVGCDRSDNSNAAPAASGRDGAARPTIAVIPKGTTHVFWQSVEAGAKEAAEAEGVDIIWKGPLKESDRSGQIEMVQRFVSQGVAGIALAPLDSKALRGPVDAAAAKGIPVVIFDSALEGQAGEQFVSFVATDNKAGGLAGGRRLAELIDGKGKVVLLRYLAGSASTAEREAGFLEALADAPDVSVTSDNQYGGATASEAQQKAMSMLATLRDADAIFTPNESSTYGMLLALRQAGLAGQKVFVGFDASPPLVEALRAGEVHALVVQNPRKMGFLAVQTLAKHLRGEPVDQRIDTGVMLVTKDNLDTPEVKAMLQ